YYTFSPGVKAGRGGGPHHVALNRGLVMAFNPFHAFRKHQKAFFAVLTIVCMLVFVLQFGAGDPFTRLMRAFGAGRGRGAAVTTLYKKTVTEGDLDQLGQRRQAVTEFMLSVVVPALYQAVNDIQKLPDPSAPNKLPPSSSDLSMLAANWSQRNLQVQIAS